MAEDIEKLAEYFRLKMEVRESIYKDEIQQLINTFNKNYDLNRGMM